MSYQVTIFTFVFLIFPVMFVFERYMVASKVISNFSRFRSKSNFARHTHPIQTIYDNLIMIPKDDIQKSVRSPLECKHLKSCIEAMDMITLSDLGFDNAEINSLDESLCANILYTRDFNIAVFLLPKGHSLPLHDHPHMTVLSKVIKGSLEMRAFSLQYNEINNSSMLNIAQTRNNGLISKLSCTATKTSTDPTWFLTPEVENIHEFKATSNCVIFDCILPPYEDPHRPCRYYEAISQDSEDEYLLKLVNDHEQHLPHSIEYSGFRPIMKKTQRGSSWDKYF